MQRGDPKGVMYCYGCVDDVEGSDGRRVGRRRFGRSLTGLTEVGEDSLTGSGGNGCEKGVGRGLG